MLSICGGSGSVAEPEPVGVGTFWSEPELKPVWRSGSGSTLDKAEEIPNYILFVCSNIDYMLIEKQFLKINEFFLVSK